MTDRLCEPLSRETHKQAGCDGKQPFTSFSRAHEVTQRMRQGASKRRGGTPYRCAHCGAWHIGSGGRS